MRTKRPTRKEIVRKTVAGHSFFTGLKPKHLDALAEIAREVKLQPDEAVLKEGASASAFFLLLEGDVALATHALGGQAMIQTLHAGDALGWSWMFEPYVWHFNAQALTPGRALKFNAKKLRELCAAKPKLGLEIYRRLAEVIMKRLQATRLQLLDWYGDNR
jgi:CRP-like cAMP-binding protein